MMEWKSFLASQRPSDESWTQGTHDDLLAARDDAVFAPLPAYGLIRVAGDDAANFLHNLLTNDIKGLTPDTHVLAGLCTPKGRLLALMRIWREEEDFLLMLPTELLPVMLKKLSMYVLRAKVKLRDVSDERVVLGARGPAAVFCEGGSASVPDTSPGRAPDASMEEAQGAAGHLHPVRKLAGGQILGLPGATPSALPQWVLCLPPEDAMGLWSRWQAAARPVTAEAWNWLEICAGRPEVFAATQEAFVPQMLNLELPEVGGVSFTKGCYPGQEIVARTQYLGKIKRRTYRAHLAASAAPGAPVFAPETGEQQCGTLVRVAPAPDGGHDALICVQSSAAQAGEIWLGAENAAKGGLQASLLTLPYTLAA